VISLVLVLLAALVLVVVLARRHAPEEAALLLGTLGLAVVAGRWLGRDLRAHPAGFPEPSVSQSLRLQPGPLDVERPGG
jgi:hypothetical protein